MRKLFFIFVLAALSLPACSRATQAAPSPFLMTPTFSPAELEISDPAKPIEVTAGSEFTITVPTGSSSTYHWEVAETIDSNVVQYVWKDHVADHPSDPNSNGRDIWRFKAVASGKTTITLGYYPGQSADTSRKEVFTVVVK